MAAKANELGFLGCENCHATPFGKANELGFQMDDGVKRAHGGAKANELGFIFDDYDDEDECHERSHRRSDRVRACRGDGAASSASGRSGGDQSLLEYVNTFLSEGYTNVSADEVFNVFRGIGQSRSKVECRKIAEAVRARARGAY